MPAEESASAHSSSISTALGPPSGASDSMPMTSISSMQCAGSGALARTQLGRHPLLVLAVGGDDPPHELVADHVLLTEADELDPLDVLEHVGDDDQTGVLLAGQVDLRDVTGHDDPGVEPEPGQEHLHLLGTGVLGL